MWAFKLKLLSNSSVAMLCLAIGFVLPSNAVAKENAVRAEIERLVCRPDLTEPDTYICDIDVRVIPTETQVQIDPALKPIPKNRVRFAPEPRPSGLAPPAADKDITIKRLPGRTPNNDRSVYLFGPERIG